MFKKIAPRQSWRIAWDSVEIRVIFRVRFQRRKNDKISRSARKLKHANSIVESFEHFSQMTSKSILIVSRYAVLKFVRFLRHNVEKHEHSPDAAVSCCELRHFHDVHVYISNRY